MRSLLQRFPRAAARVCLLAACALACCIGGSPALAGEEDAPVSAPHPIPPAAFPGDDVQDLLYLAPRQPILIRMNIQIDGRGFRAYRADFARKLFASLDLDQSGMLEGDELKGIPQPNSLVSVGPNGEVRRIATKVAADADPADGKVTAEEFSSYVRRAAGSPFEITTIALRNRVESRIFELLDADKSQSLSLDELTSTWGRLRRNDINDDEILTAAELNPQLQQNVFAAPVVSTGQPARSIQSITELLVILDPDDPDSRTAHKLVQLYDKFGRDKASGQFIKDGKIAPEELGLSADQIKRFDANADGKLDRAELKQAVANFPPQLEVSVRFQRGGEASSSVEILSQPESNRAGLAELRRNDDGHTVLLLAGLQMQLDASPAISDYNDENIKARFSNVFSNYDQDQNEYIDKDEFRRFGTVDAVFEPMDADRDGKVFLKEFIPYLENQALLARSRATFNLSRENPTLFDVIDAATDGRLSRRELQFAGANVKTWDANGDGLLQAAEIPDRYQATFGLGQRTLQVGAFQIPLSNQVTQTMVAGRPISVSGPAWFAKMDRNRDGDVSAREFLGPESAFHQLDADRNGLIDPDEARQAR